MDEVSMRILRPFVGVLILILILASLGCASLGSRSQMGFGIEAARHQLWDEAIFRWKKILQENPNSASAHNNLAIAYEKKGLWDDAEKEYQQALKIDPGNDRIQSNYKKFQKNLEGQEEEPEENEKKRRGDLR